MPIIGEMSLWVALLMAAWTAAATVVGNARQRSDFIESGRRAVHATLFMLALAVAGLLAAIFAHDFSVAHVAAYTTSNLPRMSLLSAVWAGRAGSVVFIALSLAALASIEAWRHRGKPRKGDVSIGMLGGVLFFLIAVACLGANPFERGDFIPLEGNGMAARLQKPAAVIHLPLLYVAVALTLQSLALAGVALIARRNGQESDPSFHAWACVAWLFSIAAVLTGLWWAYMEPERGTRWISYAVTGGSVVPCLVNTGLLFATHQGATASGRARYGAYLSFTGVVMAVAALAGAGFAKTASLDLSTAETKVVTDPLGTRWTFTGEGVSRYDALNRHVTALAIDLHRNEKRAGLVTSELREHFDGRGAPTSMHSVEPGVHGTWIQDVYVVFAGFDEAGRTRVRVSFNPLIRWLWVGGALLAIGGVLFFWPARVRLS